MEKPFYYYRDEWYKGSMPTFYDSATQEAAIVLRENFEVIREEVLNYFDKNLDDLQPNFTPYNYKETGWRTVNLLSYFIRYNDTLKQFPKTIEALSKLDGLSGLQISVLTPQTRIKAHIGDTNTIVRNHIGIKIPGTYPDIGFRLKNESVCWKEGGTISFCIVHRHYAWNYTDHYRIIFQCDTMLPEYRKHKFWVAGRVLSSIMTKLMATRRPALRKTPGWLLEITHYTIAIGFWTLLQLQQIFHVPIEKLFAFSRKKKIETPEK